MRLRRLTLPFVASALLLTGCGAAPTWKGGSGGSSAAPGGTAKVTTPADGARDVSTATSITFEAPAPGSTVTLQDADGTAIQGAPQAGAPTEWVPAKQLKYATEYTATVTAGGARTTAKFTTMAKPASLARTTSQIGDGQVVGVGMMTILSFSADIPARNSPCARPSAASPSAASPTERRTSPSTPPSARSSSWTSTTPPSR